MATKRKKKVDVDFSDEESVAAAMASELDIDVDDIKIKSSHLEHFGTGTFWEIGVGRTEYTVAENSEAAFDLAVQVVKQDLENEPENFERNFLESHINKDRLRRDLHSDTYDSNYDRLRDEANLRPLKFLEENSIDFPEPTKKQLKDYAEATSDEDNPASTILSKLEDMSPEEQWSEMGEEPEVPDDEVEKVAEGETDSQLEDPIRYLTDIFGDEDGLKKAIEISGIDVDAAASDAVDTDGAEHFLARYDGAINDGPGGIVYWREN